MLPNNFKKTDKVLILDPENNSDLLIDVIRKFLYLYGDGYLKERLEWCLTYNIWTWVEDKDNYEKIIFLIEKEFGKIPNKSSINNINFLSANIRLEFDWILGYLEDSSEKPNPIFKRLFGKREGLSIKPSKLSYTLVKSIDLLVEDGQMNVFLPENIMNSKKYEGIRNFLSLYGFIRIKKESIDLIGMNFIKSKKSGLEINGVKVPNEWIKCSPYSIWGWDNSFHNLFNGEKLGDYLNFTKGLDGKKITNLIKDVVDGKVTETLEYDFFRSLSDDECVIISERECLITLEIPHEYYRFYHTSTGKKVWGKPTKVVFWDIDGSILRKYVNKVDILETCGLIWDQSGKEFFPRFLPIGHLFDDSCMVGTLKKGIDDDNIYFILGWMLSSHFGNLTKETMRSSSRYSEDIISKIPYPNWVVDSSRLEIIHLVKGLIESAENNELLSEVIKKIDELIPNLKQANK